jgi:hypothetical protein
MGIYKDKLKILKSFEFPMRILHALQIIRLYYALHFDGLSIISIKIFLHVSALAAVCPLFKNLHSNLCLVPFFVRILFCMLWCTVYDSVFNYSTVSLICTVHLVHTDPGYEKKSENPAVFLSCDTDDPVLNVHGVPLCLQCAQSTQGTNCYKVFKVCSLVMKYAHIIMKVQKWSSHRAFRCRYGLEVLT